MASSITAVSLRLYPSSDSLSCRALNSVANLASILADTTVFLLLVDSIMFSIFMCTPWLVRAFALLVVSILVRRSVLRRLLSRLLHLLVLHLVKT